MLKNLLFSIVLGLISAKHFAQSISITKADGWLESAFVEWLPVSDAESYNVYISGQGLNNTKIDDQLIRNYGNHFRADILGLKAGTYTIKVAAVIAAVEKPASTSNSISVKAHDRSGFAFSNNVVPGAYNMDGTPKHNAVVLYISQNTKDSISMNITGASVNPCVGMQNILDGIKKGKDNRPFIFRLIGQITDLSYMNNGDIVVENSNNSSSHITVEGVGEDAAADGWGIRIKNASNIEIRNIGTLNCNSSEGDNVGLQQNNEYIWVHNCDFFYGDAGGDADQAKGDGALDCKKSTFITFSYNHFWDSGKCNLLGLSEETTTGLYITYHHNWYDHSDSRHPRVRYYSAHVYNNYYDGNAKYGIGSTLGSSVFVEGNYFRNCKYPMLTSMQGSDVYNESTKQNDYNENPTFSKENGGTIKAFNNYITGQKRFVPYDDINYPNSKQDFDAFVVNNRTSTIGSSVTSAYGNNTYNNFDVDNMVMYSYTPDSPEIAKTNVENYAGRMNGGDIKFTFDNTVDDESYAVNPDLKTIIISYTTSLIAIQGDGMVIKDDTTGGNNVNNGVIEPGDEIHNFTESGLSSSYYTITGSLSNSKGTVQFDGLTLTQCLKIESSTNISFTSPVGGMITLVFNLDFNGDILIDGDNYTVTNGILIESLLPGNHTITKGSSANLYLMSVKSDIVGLHENEIAGLDFYPNPVHNQLFIRNNSIEKIQIFSTQGELILNLDLTENSSIDLSNLNKGTYIVKAFKENYVFEKIIVKL